jgi:hypothetical protein
LIFRSAEKKASGATAHIDETLVKG